MLKGNRLDEVASLTFKNNVFVPGELTSNHGVDELPMVAQDPAAVSALKPERGSAGEGNAERRARISLSSARSTRRARP